MHSFRDCEIQAIFSGFGNSLATNGWNWEHLSQITDFQCWLGHLPATCHEKRTQPHYVSVSSLVKKTIIEPSSKAVEIKWDTI